MRLSKKQIAQSVLLYVLFAICITAHAQVKSTKKYIIKPKQTEQLSRFDSLANRAGVNFMMPKGFREIPALNDDDFTFDYAMDIPDAAFEVWYQVRSQKESLANFERDRADDEPPLASADSIYKEIAKVNANAFTWQSNPFVRTLPAAALKRYNADAGRSYLLTLEDTPETKSYQYALLIALQKFHTGTIIMVCFTNQKDPEFYKNVERAGSSLKFKSVSQNVSKLED
ncbi:hypothetical protein IM792_20080 [Mucilaginibacter sp. JRF]|uniref:hypothetical protein n=1 Tax=Mucilaginibacter sp. JRF TaxID=2780088 RepID=UPI00187E1775|nr:hypothetical protein [Mucilaginibacter sp. JRF]MBE9586759.1 hypothetical protein [Mucilaginibacter sp. JRF]